MNAASNARRPSLAIRILRGGFLGLIGALGALALALAAVWPLWYLATRRTGLYTALALGACCLYLGKLLYGRLARRAPARRGQAGADHGGGTGGQPD